MNVAHFFARNASRAGHLPAVALGPDILFNHLQLAHRIASLATGLRMRVGQGERVAVIADNCPQYVEIMAACWWAGLAIVPINAKLHPNELAYIVEDADVRLILVDNQHATLIQSDQPTVLIDGEAYRGWLSLDAMSVADVSSDAMAWLFYTSGTTGKPKGAMITHRNLRAMTYAYFIDIDTIAPQDCIIHAAPMSHGSGIYLLPHAAKGACQVIPSSGGFDAAEIAELWQCHSGATMFAAPTMVKRMTRHAAANGVSHQGLKTIVYGGAPMYLADLDEAHRHFGFKLAQLYGQGEAPMTITALDKTAHADVQHPNYRQRLQSAGTAQSVVEVKIGDPNGRALPPGEAGEIMARGDVVVPGYWRNPEATARTMGDGWLRTGDIGVMDDDGFFTLKDRSKDLIISGGSNIYPREVEEVLLQHKNVREVAVVGMPDPEWGEIVIAFVAASEELPTEELDQLCLNHIARFKRPKRYHFLRQLPKNNYGKILKTELRERYV